MKVLEPPYDLVVLFADLDVQQFFEAIIERGQERGCIHPIRWRSLRDPRHDSSICRQPDKSLLPFLSQHCRLMVVWDHVGSGREDEAPTAVEQSVVKTLTLAGASEAHVEAVALEPEVEALLRPEWSRVKELLAEERKSTAPDDAAVLRRLPRLLTRKDAPQTIAEALERHPKEAFLSVVQLLGLRVSASLYAGLGGQLSIPALKSENGTKRITARLQGWFPSGP